MTTPTESAPAPLAPISDAGAQVALGAGRERRLHPLSWLFVLLAQLRQFALPLLALLFFGRGGNSWEWWGLVGVALLTAMAVVRYFTYRFRVAGGELVVRSGLLHRNVRHIPLQRIQNVALKRGPLHRLLGVTEVKLESAVGGTQAEAEMKVLSLRDAHALEQLVRGAGTTSEPSDQASDTALELLRLPLSELVKLGLTSNRGLLLGAAGLGVLFQLDDAGAARWLQGAVRAGFGYAQGLHLGWTQWLFAIALGFAMLVLLLRAVSVALTVLRFFDFRLSEVDQPSRAGRSSASCDAQDSASAAAGRRPKAAARGTRTSTCSGGASGREDGTESVLSVESGLLTRVRHHAPLHKIQHWTLHESWLHRVFARRSLNVETAALQVAGHALPALSDLVPIALPAQMEALLARWLPWLQWDRIAWQPLHPKAWRRLLFAPALLTALATLALSWRLGFVGLWLLLLLPILTWRARRLAARCHWAATERALLWRTGWWEQRLSFAEIGKLQALQLVQSPFDRRHGMASVIADTAGASPFGHRLELHYLPEVEARALYTRLSAAMARDTAPG